MRLIKEQLDRENMVDIDQCEGSPFYTHRAQAVWNCHLKILMRCIPLPTVTRFTLKCASFGA